MDPVCSFLTDSICQFATEIARTKCITSQTLCHMCQKCDRPKRLNLYTAGLILANNPKQDMQILVNTMLGSRKGFGAILAAVFKPIFEEIPNCECPGHEDILNIWTKEYISNNLETVIKWLQTEAYRRSIPFSPMLCRVFLNGLLLVTEEEPISSS